MSAHWRESGLFRDESRHRTLSAGEHLFREGDEGEEMFILVAGELDITLRGQLIDRLNGGDMLGEMALVGDGLRSATATATTDLTVLPVNAARFTELVGKYPEFARDVMSVMSSRLRRLITQEVQRQRLEQEMAIGHQIQLSLLPEQSPTIEGWQFKSFYQAARQVGGDFYDFVLTPERPKALNIIVGDVTGKGVPAAMFMAVTRTLIRSETFNRESPAEALERANALLRRDSRAPLFLGASLMAVDTDSGAFTFANAGHELPLWLHMATGAVERIEARGMVLGAFDQTFSQEVSGTLQSGDAVLFFTDGVTEARDAAGDFFGDERLEAALRTCGGLTAAGIAEQVVAAVMQFTGDMPQADDLTLVVAQRA